MITRRSFLRLTAGGLFVPGTMFGAISAKVSSRTIGGVVDNRVTLVGDASNQSYIARTLPFSYASWNSVRVGIRFICDGSASSGSDFPSLAIGLATALPSFTTLIGCQSQSAQWVYHAAGGGNFAYYGTLSWYVYRYDATWASTLITNTAYIPADPTTENRKVIMADIIKGSPNWTLKVLTPASALDGNDITENTFLTQMDAGSPTLAQHSYDSTGKTIAFSGTPNVAYAAMYPASAGSNIKAEICDFMIKKLS